MRSTILAAAIAGVFATSALAGDTNSNDATLPTGVTAKALNDQQDIRSVLAAATNAAVAKGGLDDMIERLTTPDQKRVGEFFEHEFTEIDGRIEQISKNWQHKYGESFNLNNDELFAGFVTIVEGEVTDAAAARSHWPVPVRSSRDVAPNDANTVEYLENGRNVAVVRVPASHDLPAITISMLHEPIDDWRIDIPDNITAQQIHDNVKAALTDLGDNVAQWPADKTQAYRAFGHRLLMAIYDVPHAERSATVDKD